MGCTVTIKTVLASFAHDLSEQLTALGHQVVLSFEEPARCRAIAGASALDDLALWRALAPMRLPRRHAPELPHDALILELGGPDAVRRLSHTELILESADPAPHHATLRSLEPIGFRGVRHRSARPSQAIMRFGGAPHLARAVSAWYLAREGFQLEWAQVWELSEAQLCLSLPSASSRDKGAEQAASASSPAAWSIELSCDDEALTELIRARLDERGFVDLELSPSEELKELGLSLSWRGAALSEELKLLLWSALSEAERERLGEGETISPRCEHNGAPRPPRLEAPQALQPRLTPTLSISASLRDARPEHRRLRALAQLSRHSICLKSSESELSPIARLIRSFKPEEFTLYSPEEWASLAELLLELEGDRYPPDLAERGEHWGEIHCSRGSLALATWLRNELEPLLKVGPSVKVTQALKRRELWLLFP